MAWNKIVIYAVQEMYIFQYKQGRQMPIDFYIITHILGVYMGYI